MRYDLYINYQLCDLDDESLIVLTYTMEQLTNPTAVKNTYSHEVELPQTKRNDEIFAHFYRNDYNAVGYIFEPTAQVPFVIYNELGEISESGYIKIDEINIDNTAHKYKVTLYGGLGSFFTTLAFNDGGDALALYDLQYADNKVIAEDNMNLTITRGSVDRAWKRLAGKNSDYVSDIINFAPMYQGLPDGEFDADKALFIGRSTTKGNTPNAPIYGIASSLPSGMAYYKRLAADGSDTGYRISLVQLNDSHNEWEMQDLRSYLQRPVLSVKKFVEAVQRRVSANGYKLNLDTSFFNEGNPYYDKAWLTLPSLQKIARNKKEADIQLSAELLIDGSAWQTFPIAVTGASLDTYEVGVTAKDVTATIERLVVKLDEYRYFAGERSNVYSLSAPHSYNNIWCIQIYGMAGGKAVAWSDVKVLASTTTKDAAATLANKAGHLPIGANAKYEKVQGDFYAIGDGLVQMSKSMDFNITTISTTSEISWYAKVDKYAVRGNTSDFNKLYASYAGSSTIVEGGVSRLVGKAKVGTNENVRSGAIVMKKELLDIGKTPLDVLLSYCKMFGLVWQYDNKNKEVNLMARSSFYGAAGVEDWNARIDRSRTITIKPFVFDKRFYDLSLKAKGGWAEEYEAKYGVVYGRQRIDTGYSFERESKNLLENSALSGGAEVLKQSKFFCNVTQDTYSLGDKTYNKICPAVFLEGGKYAFYKNGEPTEYEITKPTADATITYYNEAQGYDWLPKLEMQKDNKLVEDFGTLLIHAGNIAITEDSPYRNLRLTDDVVEMPVLNDGVPCWVLEGSVYGSLVGDTLPHFVRTGLNVSLDFGVPKEIDNPSPDMEAVENTIYAQYWRDYLSDRYDKNSRVMTAYVDLRGLQVDNRLFRKFYFFDNAYWVLNKIANYSMTTEGTTQCEFVKVQDIKNYIG